MGIQQWSKDIILVNLPAEPYLGEELASVLAMVAQQANRNVVIDFSEVDIITSSSLSKLLKLRKTLFDNDRHLTFCSVKPKTYQIFKITGLDSVFEFVDNAFVALAGLQLKS